MASDTVARLRAGADRHLADMAAAICMDKDLDHLDADELDQLAQHLLKASSAVIQRRLAVLRGTVRVAGGLTLVATDGVLTTAGRDLLAARKPARTRKPSPKSPAKEGVPV